MEFSENELQELHPSDFEDNFSRKGTYSTVRKVKCNGIICAARIFNDDEESKRMFKQECQMRKKLSHKNIVKLLGVSSANGKNVLVLEFMEYNLTELLTEKEGMEMHLKLSLMCDISDGVHYLHTHDPPIAHLNLSSFKIYVNSDYCAKLSSFKIAKEINPDQIIIREKTEDQVIRLPEHSNIGTSSDVFFLGCILRRIISQIYQPPKRTKAEAMNEASRREISTSNPALRELIMSCLHNNPENRPKSLEVCQILKKIGN